MPVVLGPFETSLRGGDSPSPDRKKFLHKGCCGSLHGHGVPKERPPVRASVSKTRSLEGSSSDESHISELLLRPSSSASSTRTVQARSQSTDCSHPSNGHQTAKRSSSAVVAQRLFSSPTKSTTAKLRAERTASDGRRMTLEMKRVQQLSTQTSGGGSMNGLSGRGRVLKPGEDYEHDSGHFSSDTDGPNFSNNLETPPLEERKQSLINGASDDELSIVELRRRQRRERRDYVQTRSPKTNGGTNGGGKPPSRKASPSPGPKKNRAYGDRGRRSSDECTDESISPPTTPSPPNARSISLKPWSRALQTEMTSARRASSSSGGKQLRQKGGYGFGSSTARFPAKKPVSKSASSAGAGTGNSTKKPVPPLNKSASDGVANALEDQSGGSGGAATPLNRAASDPKVVEVNEARGGGSSPHNKGATPNHIVNKKANAVSATTAVSVSTRKQQAKQERKDSVTKAWMKFKEEVETALQKKPNQGFYKNLSDMMHTKMEMLRRNEVRIV